MKWQSAYDLRLAQGRVSRRDLLPAGPLSGCLCRAGWSRFCFLSPPPIPTSRPLGGPRWETICTSQKQTWQLTGHVPDAPPERSWGRPTGPGPESVEASATLPARNSSESRYCADDMLPLPKKETRRPPRTPGAGRPQAVSTRLFSHAHTMYRARRQIHFLACACRPVCPS